MIQSSLRGSENVRKCIKTVRAFSLKYAEENSSRPSNVEITILKKASQILRRRTLKFMKEDPMKSTDFKVAFCENQQQFPPELTSLMERFLFGQQKLVSENSKEKHYQGQ